MRVGALVLSGVGGVGGGRVGGFVGFVFGVFGLSGVLDVSDVSGITIDLVGDGLDASVGKQNLVGAGHDFAVAVLLGAVVVVGVVVLDGVGVVVRQSRLQYFTDKNCKLGVGYWIFKVGY